MRKKLNLVGVVALFAVLGFLIARDPYVQQATKIIPTFAGAAPDISAEVKATAQAHCEQFAAQRGAVCVSVYVAHGYQRGTLNGEGMSYAVIESYKTPTGSAVLGWFFHYGTDGNLEEVE